MVYGRCVRGEGQDATKLVLLSHTVCGTHLWPQVMSSQAAVNTVEQALQLAWFPEASGLTRQAADDGPTRTRQQSRALRAMQQHTHHGKALAPGCQVKAGSGATPTVVELFGRTGAQLSGHVRSNAALGRKVRVVLFVDGPPS